MNAQEMLKLWAANPVFDEETRREVGKIAADEREVLSRFGRELSFGTGGLRGVLGAGTNRMNRYTVARATQGIAAYLNSRAGKSVAIAYDSRNGSNAFALVAAGVLAANGIRAYCYNRLMPTPMLSFAVRALHCDAGIVITASHNPAEYNGYKVYGADGCQITDQAAAEITAFIDKVAYPQLSWLGELKARALHLLEDVPETVYQAFLDKTLSCRVEKSGTPFSIRMVYTPLHGTGLEPIRDVFKRMGFPGCVEVREQCVPDGNFPTCPKPNPELREALRLAIETAKRENADLVTATDPDCDRIGVAVRDRAGDYQILTGNEVGLLLMAYILRSRLEKGTMPLSPVVIKTIVTSDLAFAVARQYGAEVWEVLTGFKYIGEAIGRMAAEGQEDRFVFGFEESCGYLAGTHVRDKDGVMACMLVTDMAQHYASLGQSLLEVLEALYGTYGYMQNVLLNYDILDALPMQKMQAIMAGLRKNPPKTLGETAVTSSKDYLEGLSGLPVSDVLSFENAQGDKAIVRPSGTEPKVKVYLFAKGQGRAETHAKLEKMTQQANGWIGI